MASVGRTAQPEICNLKRQTSAHAHNYLADAVEEIVTGTPPAAI